MEDADRGFRKGKLADQGKAEQRLLLHSGEHPRFGTPLYYGQDTRQHVDFRIAEGMVSDYLARKIPAGYFHLIPDTEEEEEGWQRVRLAMRLSKTESRTSSTIANNTLVSLQHSSASAALHTR